MKSYSSLIEETRGHMDIEKDYENKKFVLCDGPIRYVFDLDDIIDRICPPYLITKPDGGWKRDFTEQEKIKLRPMAETLAMLDGNAFFTNKGTRELSDGSRIECDWYEMYLSSAHALYEGNGGDTGWAGETAIRRNASE